MKRRELPHSHVWDCTLFFAQLLYAFPCFFTSLLRCSSKAIGGDIFLYSFCLSMDRAPLCDTFLTSLVLQQYKMHTKCVFTGLEPLTSHWQNLANWAKGSCSRWASTFYTCPSEHPTWVRRQTQVRATSRLESLQAHESHVLCTSMYKGGSCWHNRTCIL
jgi:hypothetical protein